MTPPCWIAWSSKCLAKDPDERWQTHGPHDELKWIAESASTVSVTPLRAVRSRNRERVAWAVAVLSLIAALIFFATRPPRAPIDNSVKRLTMTAPDEIQAVDISATPLVSPDGRHVVFRARDSSGTYLLWVRPLDSSGRPLPGTEEASSFSFWSPDSRFIGFLSQGKLKKAPLFGGPVQTICDTGIMEGWKYSEGAWNRDGVILFMPNGARCAVCRSCFRRRATPGNNTR